MISTNQPSTAARYIRERVDCLQASMLDEARHSARISLQYIQAELARDAKDISPKGNPVVNQSTVNGTQRADDCKLTGECTKLAAETAGHISTRMPVTTGRVKSSR